LKVFYEVSRVMDEVELRHKDLVPLFLTLTLKNCPADALNETLDKIFKGWYRFTNHRKIKTLIHGWFRALEVTYDGDKVITKKRYEDSEDLKDYYDRLGLKIGDPNPNFDNCHPHIHAIILVDKSYFKVNYMKTEEWVRLWRVSLGLDYDPICDIRRVKNLNERRKGIHEVAKYTFKDTEIATKDKELTDHIVKILSKALKGRRLYAFGGLLKEIAASLAIKDLGEGDLIHLRDTIREDVATVVERYHWHFGLANYVRFKK
jgi:plasmid rolling circle replication initiator protein Rep